MEVTIEIDDVSVRQMLTRAPAQINRATRRAMTDATVWLLRQMRTYPPARRASAYKRTGTLRRSWSRRIEGSGVGITGIVGSNSEMTRLRDGTSYNRLVQDATRQASVHRGRWTNTVQAVTERSRGQINDMFQARLREELR